MELTVVVPLVIFGVALFFILSEKIHRTIVALVGATAMVISGHFLGFYGEMEAIVAIDFNTIGLLMGMMVLVALLANTGVFEYLAIVAGQKAKGRPWALLVILGLTTGVVSMFLDNVTTVILIAPVTLQIASILRINPVPLLIGEALLSNVMGTGTLVGDPPNIIIGAATEAAATINLNADGSAIFNNQGAAVDFIIEGDTDTTLFNVLGATDTVRINLLNINSVYIYIMKCYLSFRF